MNFGLFAEVISASAVVMLRHTEIGIYYFACPAGGCYACASICLAVGFPPVVVYLQSTQDLVWWLCACFCVDHQVLVVCLGGKLVLLLMLLPVFLAQCSLFHRLTRMMSRGFVCDFFVSLF
jgi:hypothetical protein